MVYRARLLERVRKFVDQFACQNQAPLGKNNNVPGRRADILFVAQIRVRIRRKPFRI